jgi:hypothetical protein
MAGGQQSDFGQGSFGNSIEARLRSKRGDEGTSSRELSGSQATFAQGALGKSRTKALSGSSATGQAGNVSPSHPSDEADFIARSTASGVIASNNFNSSAELGEDWTLTGGNFSTARFGWESGTDVNAAVPEIDTNVKLSGSGSLRLTLNSGSTANGCGKWVTRFPVVSGGSTYRTFGENQEFWLQYRFRVNAGYLQVVGQNEGTKLSDIGTGNTSPSLVLQTWSNTLYPFVYLGSSNPGLYGQNGSDILLQNGTAPYCVYPGSPGCWSLVADEWVTCKFHVAIGAKRNATHWDAHVKMWLKRYGQPSQLVLDYGPETEGYDINLPNGFPYTGNSPEGYPQFLFFIYTTDKGTGVRENTHATAYAWYDELIISTEEIADPVDGVASYPVWRSGKTVGQTYAIADTAYMGDSTYTAFTFNQQDNLIDAYCGNVMDQTNNRWLIVNGGGHAQTCNTGYTNAVVEMDFMADEPAWEFIDEGTVLADLTPNRYMLDGRPAARHTYNKGIYIAPGQMADGKERCGQVTGAAGLAQNWDGGLENTCSWTDDGSGTWVYGPGFELFRLDPADWFAHNTFDGSVHGWELQNNSRNAPQFNFDPGGGDAYGMPAQDQRTGDVYWVGTSSGYPRLFKWTAATDTWSAALVDGFTTSAFRGSGASQMLVDTIRERLVILWAGVTNGTGNTPDRLIFVDLATYAVTSLTLPAQGQNWGGPSRQLAHDLDNDRYVFLRHEGSADGNGAYVYRLYGMSPTTGVITDLSGALPQEMESGLGFHIGFIPDLHCIVWMTGHTTPIRFMPTA